MKMKYVLMMSILLSIFVGNAYAPDTEKFKICVIVEYEEEPEKTEAQIIESHLKKELRALGDVIVVDKKADWQFRLWVSIAIPRWDRDDTKTPNIIIAYNYQHRLPTSYLDGYWDEHPHIPTFSYNPIINIWDRNNLPVLCVGIANRIDKKLSAHRDLTLSERSIILYYP